MQLYFEFEKKKARLLNESASNDWILIDNGDTFEGTWEQVADCFGITGRTFEAWCEFNNMEFSIETIDVVDIG